MFAKFPRMRRILATRIVGAVLATAGFAFLGMGTLSSHTIFKSAPVTAVFTCTTGQECIKPSQVPTTADQSGCGDISGFVTEDADHNYWHFVSPHTDNSNPDEFKFTDASLFHTVFDGSDGTGGTIVQSGKGMLVTSAAGATLDWAYVGDAGTDEASDSTAAEGDDFVLSGTCAPATTTTTSTVTTTSTKPTTTTSTVTTTSTSPTTTTTTTTVTTTSTNPTTTTVTTSETSTVTTTSSGSSQSSSGGGAASTSTSNTSQASGVAGVSTTTPNTGADINFGIGLLLVGLGGSLVGGAGHLHRRNRRR